MSDVPHEQRVSMAMIEAIDRSAELPEDLLAVALVAFERARGEAQRVAGCPRPALRGRATSPGRRDLAPEHASLRSPSRLLGQDAGGAVARSLSRPLGARRPPGRGRCSVQ
jgi:hypothetical protein